METRTVYHGDKGAGTVGREVKDCRNKEMGWGMQRATRQRQEMRLSSKGPEQRGGGPLKWH